MDRSAQYKRKQGAPLIKENKLRSAGDTTSKNESKRLAGDNGMTKR